ncbi:hypothetical protein CDAR_51291 [Caerostris darwini]|uniref:Uncharacterized protein n=1 Tax=Caerostris darwini TaxID=1538125 RepID=A0AAV4U5X6_9ARAC|nr:hypothetical protein CDAR_51291 [Caerostris darwini]
MFKYVCVVTNTFVLSKKERSLLRSCEERILYESQRKSSAVNQSNNETRIDTKRTTGGKEFFVNLASSTNPPLIMFFFFILRSIDTRIKVRRIIPPQTPRTDKTLLKAHMKGCLCSRTCSIIMIPKTKIKWLLLQRLSVFGPALTHSLLASPLPRRSGASLLGGDQEQFPFLFVLLMFLRTMQD